MQILEPSHILTHWGVGFSGWLTPLVLKAKIEINTLQCIKIKVEKYVKKNKEEK